MNWTSFPFANILLTIALHLTRIKVRTKKQDEIMFLAFFGKPTELLDKMYISFYRRYTIVNIEIIHACNKEWILKMFFYKSSYFSAIHLLRFVFFNPFLLYIVVNNPFFIVWERSFKKWFVLLRLSSESQVWMRFLNFFPLNPDDPKTSSRFTYPSFLNFFITYLWAMRSVYVMSCAVWYEINLNQPFDWHVIQRVQHGLNVFDHPGQNFNFWTKKRHLFMGQLL